jgi:hypothetical protein
MRESARFLLDEIYRAAKDLSPTLTVLGYLRSAEELRGTKEGCSVDDGAAFTVVLGKAVGDSMRYRAVNSRIMFTPAQDGEQFLIVEHLRGADGTPHPVQHALVQPRLDRDDDMIPTCGRHEFRIDHDVGFDSEGGILGISFTQAGRRGYSPDRSGAICDRAMFHADNCYYLDHACIISYRPTRRFVASADRGA